MSEKISINGKEYLIDQMSEGDLAQLEKITGYLNKQEEYQEAANACRVMANLEVTALENSLKTAEFERLLDKYLPKEQEGTTEE